MAAKKTTVAEGEAPKTRTTRAKKSDTTSGVADTVSAQDTGASVVSNTVVQSVPQQLVSQHKDKTMSDDNVSIIEFSDDIASAEQPDPLPVAEYPADIKAVEVKESAKGTRYAAVSFYIAPDAYPADYPLENAPDGTTLVYRRCSLEDNPNARFRLRQFCEAIGAPMSKRIDVSEWVGLTARIAISHDEYEGVKRAQVDKVLAS